ncbi:MAG: glycine zipper domain-containing protein [Phycisphaerales bacterium]
MNTSQTVASVAGRFCLVLVSCCAVIWQGGCSSSAQTGAVAGGGIGALMGQAVGRNTTGTLIGAAVGTGAGYMIGNEMDRGAAREEQARRDAERARRDREHQAAIRDLESRQAELEAQASASAQTTGTFVPPAWPSSTDQMRPLVDTAWRVTSMTPPPRRQFHSMTLHFQPNGHVITTTHYSDGSMRVDSETFRVVGNTLIINGSDYLTNSTWSIAGGRMTLVNQGFRTTLERVGDGD